MENSNEYFATVKYHLRTRIYRYTSRFKSQFQLLSFNQLKIETVFELIACGKANHKLVGCMRAVKWQELRENVQNVYSYMRPANTYEFVSMVQVKYFGQIQIEMSK